MGFSDTFAVIGMMLAIAAVVLLFARKTGPGAVPAADIEAALIALQIRAREPWGSRGKAGASLQVTYELAFSTAASTGLACHGGHSCRAMVQKISLLLRQPLMTKNKAQQPFRGQHLELLQSRTWAHIPARASCQFTQRRELRLCCCLRSCYLAMRGSLGVLSQIHLKDFRAR